MTDEYNQDPPDSPITRHILYTNDVTRMLSCFVQGLLTVARPDRVKRSLESVLENWDERVKMAKGMAELMAKEHGEPSGWREPDKEN